jgi:hypothetical protein
VRTSLLSLVTVLAAACSGPTYVGMSRQLAVDGEAAEGEPVVERQRSYFEDDRSRPRLETAVKLYPDGTRVKHGPEREWYDDGQLRWEREFRDGEPFGRWVSWHANGAKASEATFGSNELTEMTWWHDNGQVSTRGKARDAARQGSWNSWYASGAKRWEGEYRDNLREGVWTFWNADGSLAERGAFRADERVGRWERGQR